MHVDSLLRFTSVAVLFSLVSCASLGCGSGSESNAPDTTSEDLAADAVDARLIQNAEALFDKALYQGGESAPLEITYAELPSKLAEDVASNNPDPKAEWAARAFRATVKNATGHATRVFMVMDGIDDEGETDTIYSSRGRELATGGTYRSTLPTWITVAK